MTEDSDARERDRGTGTGGEAEGDGGPAPGVKPARAKRRRTASMKVSRPKQAAPATPAPEAEPPAQPFSGPRWQRLREYLDSPAGVAVLIVTAVAGVALGPLAIYSLFAMAYLVRRPLRRWVALVPLGPRTTVGVLILLVGLVREVLVWGYVYAYADAGTLLLWHTQLGPDLLLNIGVYGAWGIGWGVALTWFRYRLPEVLVIQAVFGLVIEKLGQPLLLGLATLPVGLILLAYTMILSASTVGLAWLLAGDKLRELTGPGRFNAYRRAAPALLTMLTTVAVLVVWFRLLQLLDAWPPLGPIRERPFW